MLSNPWITLKGYLKKLCVLILYVLMPIEGAGASNDCEHNHSLNHCNLKVSEGDSKALPIHCNSQAKGQLQPPSVVTDLCSNQEELALIAENGQRHSFRKSAGVALSCEAGKIWKVIENGGEVPDAAVFYFDEKGQLLEVCQALYWRSGCEKFKHINCAQNNYCED